MKISVSTITLPGARLEGENPLPRFRDPVQDRALVHDGSFSPADERLFGYQTGKRVLPCNMQDRFRRDLAPRTLKTVVLENEHLRAVFLPEWGARLYSLTERQSGRELLYRNEALQLGNLSQRAAWFSGGIEFNFGHYGHSTLTCEPHYAAIVEGPDGEFLRFYELERTTNAFYQMDFHLPDGASTLDLHVRLIGSATEDTPSYWWTNAALPQTPGCRVFCGASRVLFILPRPAGSPDSVPCFGAGEMPTIKTVAGDASYPARIDFSCEYFFQCERPEQRWEAIGYESGEPLFFEASAGALHYRKMFCWGDLPGGKRWQRHLNHPPDSEYLELQAGIAPTQLHGYVIPAGETVAFTQCFGAADLPGEDCLTGDWKTGCAAVERRIRAVLPLGELERRHEAYRTQAELPVRDLLHQGSGWAVLERIRLEEADLPVPAGLCLPDAALGAAQLPWLGLLRHGILPEQSPGELPGGWMTAKPWAELLERSLDREGGRNRLSLLHRGVQCMELGREAEAEQAWTASLALTPSAMVLRNLAQLCLRREQPEAALDYMERAVTAPGGADPAFTEEYLTLLARCGRHTRCMEHFNNVPADAATDRMWIAAAESALELGDFAFLDRVFARPFATLAEGDNILADLWFRREAKRTGRPLGEIKRELAPPAEIDFRMNRE